MLSYNPEKLQDLLKDFYSLTEIKICIFDSEGNEIAFYPEHLCSFCNYVRTSGKGKQMCLESDKKAFEICKNTGEKFVYNCHLGLIECVSPIVYNGENIGFIMLGQAHGVENSFDKIKNKIIAYGLDLDLSQKLYEETVFTPEDKVKAAIHIMEACAGYLYLKRLIVLKEQNLKNKIAKFVKDNIKNKISVDILCTEFYVSRVELYKLFKDYFGCTVADYIKKTRLDYACGMLKDTGFKISVIAAESGISDYNYFTKLFKKEFNITPVKYRKSVQ